MMNLPEYEKSYTDLVRRHERIIFSVCFFYATADIPFEDLRQEVLISLFKGFRRFKGESSESTWVYKVSINTCLFALRSFRHRIATVGLESLADLDPSVEADENLRSRLEWLRKAISRLNPMDKAIIVMWLDELSYDEIAANMGVPRNTIASRLHRIKEKLSTQKEI